MLDADIAKVNPCPNRQANELMCSHPDCEICFELFSAAMTEDVLRRHLKKYPWLKDIGKYITDNDN
jgi:hypothetical protein